MAVRHHVGTGTERWHGDKCLRRQGVCMMICTQTLNIRTVASSAAVSVWGAARRKVVRQRRCGVSDSIHVENERPRKSQSHNTNPYTVEKKQAIGHRYPRQHSNSRTADTMFEWFIGKSFDPEKDIPDLSGKVILITGGKFSTSLRAKHAI